MSCTCTNIMHNANVGKTGATRRRRRQGWAVPVLLAYLGPEKTNKQKVKIKLV